MIMEHAINGIYKMIRPSRIIGLEAIVAN